MWVGGEPTAGIKLLTKPLQVSFVNPAFQEGAGIDPGRRVTLKINLIPGEFSGPGAKEMVEGHFIESRRRSVSRNMCSQTAVRAIGVYHHGHGIPADITLDSTLHFPITR